MPPKAEFVITTLWKVLMLSSLLTFVEQAISNTKDTVNDIVKTGVDAAGVAAGHVGDAISGN